MDGVWLMINNSKPKNYILSSGVMHSIRDFLEETLKCAKIKYKKEGYKEKEKYYTLDGDLFFQVNSKFYRPAEVHKLCGDCSLAEKELGWQKKNTFQDLVKKMYHHDYKLAS